MEDLSDTIRDTAASPAEASVDGQTVKQQPLADQILADRYLASKKTARRKGLGVKFVKLSPSGTS